MKNQIFRGGVWSAAPTPLLENNKIDTSSLKRLTEHHIKLGVDGVFLCGTSGEGPWMTAEMCKEVVKTTVKAAAGKLKITAQVTDNSALKILDNIKQFADCGVDALIVAPPYFALNADQTYLKKMFLEVLDNSPVPIGFYHRRPYYKVGVETETVLEFMDHPNLLMIKDSSSDFDTMNKFVVRTREMSSPPLLFDGNEFKSVEYLKAGYDGVMFGGGCFNGCMANQILKAASEGDFDKAQEWQDRMNAMMLEFFGGEGFPYWLAGQKQVLVELGIFSSRRTIINFSLPEEYIKTIQAAIDRERAFLIMPGE